MVACLEKTEENAEFHQIVDFLSTCSINYALTTEENAEFHQIVDFLSICSINYALTVSPTIYAFYIKQFWNTAISKTVNSVKQIHAIVDGKVVVISVASVRSDLLFNDKYGGGNSVERAITTDANLVAAQDSDNIAKTQSTAMSNDPISQEIGLGDRPKRQETTLGVQMLKLGGYTPRSNEPNLLELMNICTKFSNRVLALEEAKTTQDKVITILKLRVRRLEKKRKTTTSQPMKRRLFKGRVETSTDKSFGKDASKQGRNDGQTEELNLTNGADTEVIVKDKGSGEKEPEKLHKVKRRDQGLAQIESDADFAQRIYEEELAELDRAKKERQKQEEATITALTEEFDEIQARMDADHELAVRMTHEEQEMYTIEERARLLAEYFARRKKQLEAERAEAIRNKPPTRTQVRNRMITYLKHMDKEETVDPEILSTKYPLVDWESHILGNVDMEDKHVYKIIRANRNTSYHKSLSSVLRKFDRQDLVDLHRENVSYHQGNAGEDVELEARS
uniref:Xylulose kinase-1 n=1 Tax=Tanacetum cinerariifolium TaxID=118510 RepID=A0A6L2JU47_TANCI|nr:hypothetical protein [Tanacetum cinerariifolium]